MNPLYIPNFTGLIALGEHFQTWMGSVPWLDVTSARLECFMSKGGGVSYTYGEGRGVRTYTSIPDTWEVDLLQQQVNDFILRHYGWGPMNGCFLNRYDDHRRALGWHADDFRKMDHTRPIAVVSLGQAREIWWRPNGERGIVPEAQRQLLEHGSLFLMPPGMQHTHEHRIPKGSHEMSPRVSLTFRAFKEI
jgi:alkylated DNA repair dioxygenase AlkB